MCGAYERVLPDDVVQALETADLIGVGNFQSWMSWLIMYLTHSQISHIAVYVGDRKISHATLQGIKVEPIEALFGEHVRLLVCKVSVPEASRKHRIWKDIDQNPRFAGRPYSLWRVVLKGMWIVSGRDVSYFRWAIFADISFCIIAVDGLAWIAIGRPVGAWTVIIGYLAMILVNWLRWPPRRSSWFTRNRQTPIGFLAQFVGSDAALFVDPMSPWSRRTLGNPRSPWISHVFRPK